MNKSTWGVAVAITTAGLVLSGCASSTKTAPSSAATDTPSSSAKASAPRSAPPPPAQAGKAYTIVDYIKDNGITEAVVHRGDPGSPTLNLPVPDGWADSGPKVPQQAWGQIVFTGPAAGPNPPTITAIMSKLTGNVDVAKILEYAPNEIKNLPGYSGGKDGQKTTLGGYDGVQVGGSYVKDGVKLMVAQKTVSIPAKDGLFVLQLNAAGPEGQMGPLMDATTTIDKQTTITP